MKKTNNLLLVALLTVGLGMNFTSCKDDELTEEEKQQQAEQARAEAQEWWDVVSQLTDVQTLPDDWQKATFEPTVGTASENDPYTRVVATNNLSTAAQRFAYLTGAAVDETTADYTWSHKQAGSLTYHAGSTAGTYLAQVDVDLKQMPRLKKILYQTPEQIGENASGSFSGTAYYRFGDVVKKQNSKGFDDYWVCVRPAFSLEGKGDSHWVCLSDLPDENLYTYDYGKQSWTLPTKLGESKEHMQNFAEMMYAMLHPLQYFANLGMNSKLAVFHDFKRESVQKYHNQYFWERVCYAWEREKIFEDVFNLMTKTEVENLMNDEGLHFLYKGYSWLTSFSWNCSLYEATYKNGRANKANMHDATYSKPTKSMEDTQFKANIFNQDQGYYCQEFFGNDIPRFILRYATGETLSKDANGKGNYSVKLPLSNCEDVYVYNKYFYQHTHDKLYDLNSEPEVTAKPSKAHGFFAPGTVIRDAEGNHWICYSSWYDDPDNNNEDQKSLDHRSRFLSFDAVKSTTVSVTSSDPAIKTGIFATNLVTDDEAVIMSLALRGAAKPASMSERVLAASLSENLGVNPADLIIERDSVVTIAGSSATASITFLNLAFEKDIYPVDEYQVQFFMRYVFDGTRVAGNRTDGHPYHYFYTGHSLNQTPLNDPTLDATQSFYWSGRTYFNETVEDYYVPFDRWSHCKRTDTGKRDGDFTPYKEQYDWRKFKPGAKPRRYSTYFEPITFVAFLAIDDDNSPSFFGSYGGKTYTLVSDPMTPQDKDLNFNNWVEFNSGVKKYLFYDDGQMESE